MTTPRLVIVILALTILSSCGKTIRLTDKDFKWIPYKGNEILVFNSNTGDTDTIFLLGTSLEKVPSDPLDGFPTKLEHFTIAARSSDPSPPSVHQRYLENEFLQLSASEEVSSYLTLHLVGKDAWFYGGEFMKLKDLDTINPISLTTKLRAYNDIILLYPESNEYADRSSFIKKVYWSKSEGLIRYDKQDSVYWELGKKYSP